MSDAFLNTLETMPVGDTIIYYAASPASRDKLLKFLNMQEYSVSIQEQGSRHFKLTIFRKARFFSSVRD